LFAQSLMLKLPMRQKLEEIVSCNSIYKVYG
jgi:hypothetical protein